MSALPAIQTTTMTTGQLQRTYCLMIVRLIWPTIDPAPAMQIAKWLSDGSAGDRS